MKNKDNRFKEDIMTILLLLTMVSPILVLGVILNYFIFGTFFG